MRDTGVNLRVAIVEDELPARARLRAMLREYPDLEVVGEADSVKRGLEMLRAATPDVLFLDVRLGGGNGFELLRMLPAPWPAVVFVTAFSDFAVRAFEVHAIDYLLKPFERSRLDECVQRLRDRAARADRGEVRELLEQALESALARASATGAADLRIVAQQHGALVMLDPTEIDYIESDRNYVWFRCGARRLQGRYTLTELATRLDPAHFSRVHRSLIVNLRRVRSLLRTDRGDVRIELADGSVLNCGASYRQPLLARLGVVRRSRRPRTDAPDA
jgi:two-component system LytT family response regulator